MAIIVSKNGNNAKKLDESKFGLEDKLQEYVKNNPDIIPIYEISEDAKLLVLAREFSTNSGPIDALGVDQDGNIYVIETKLYKNPDKRIVLAQALDYGASLWRHSGDSTDFIEKIDKKVSEQFGVTLEAKLQDFFGIDDDGYIVETMGKNVLSGNIKFVILMDTVEDRLKDLITYVNQNSRFDIYAVDLEYYKHEEFEIIIPKLYGSEVKKTVGKTEDRKFDNKKIITWIEEASIDNLTIDFRSTTKSYVRFNSKRLDTIMPSRSENNNSWSSNTAYYYEIQTSAAGWIKVLLSLNSKGSSKNQKVGQAQVTKHARLNPKDGWTYFIAKAWNVDTESGEEGIKKSIIGILTSKIPEFESKILG